MRVSQVQLFPSNDTFRLRSTRSVSAQVQLFPSNASFFLWIGNQIWRRVSGVSVRPFEASFHVSQVCLCGLLWPVSTCLRSICVAFSGLFPRVSGLSVRPFEASFHMFQVCKAYPNR